MQPPVPAPRQSALCADLPSTVPFVGPEAQQRARGRPFRARIGANECAFGPSPRAVAAMATAAAESWMYGDPENHDLKAAIAAHHRVAPGNVMVGEGIDGLFGYAVRLFLDPGDTVVTSRGAYPTFNFHVTGYGGQLQFAAYEQDRENPPALLDLARAHSARMIYFANPDNPLAHHGGTGPEIWRDTHGRVTHFIASMGTTGTIMGASAYLKAQNPAIQIIGVQPGEGARIPGIRRWPEAYLPKIYDPARVDRIEQVTQDEAEHMTRELGRREGIFCGISSGGAMVVALRLSAELENAVIISIVCDRGDRYLSTGVFPD